MKTKILSILALLLPLIVGEVQAQKSPPSKHGFEQNGKSANARETFGQNRNSANAREVQSATTAQTPSRRSVLRAPSTDALAPTDVTARGITPTSATVSWNGTGDSYNLRYRKMIIEGFESCSHGELPAGWTALDADGDGHSWFAWDYSKEPYDYLDNPQSFNGKSVDSESYLGGIGALTPDNWLISPQVPLKGELSLWVRGFDPDYVAEHFAIYLSTTGKDVADFTTVLIPETVAQGVLTEYTADLSAYAGQVGYIAIRHFNVTDQYRLSVDNITFTDNWVEVDGVTSPYTLDGLDDHSIYEVEVQAVTGEQQSSWSTLRFNTSGFPPTNVTILYQQNFDDTNDINELGWTFVDNDGNGLNWTMSINGKYDMAEVSPLETSTSFPNSLYSLSFTDDGKSAINADNWAITPAIEIYESSILSFQLAYGNPNYSDKVGVYVGETANVNEMTEVLAPTSFSRTAKRQFNEETVDLSAFAGKTCYIAFRHQENNKSVAFIDDVTVYTTATKHDLTLADGTEDAANWQGKAGEGEYQALPLEGVFAGTAVSVKYNGTKKVIGVKAEKKAAAEPTAANATATDIGKVVCAAGHLHEAKTAVPDGCTAVGILGKVTETGHGLILALHDATMQDWNTINGWASASYAGTTLKVLPDDAARGANLTSYTTLGETTVSNWAVAQKSDYEAIFTNLGSTTVDSFGMIYDDNVNAYITGAGGTAKDNSYWSATEDVLFGDEEEACRFDGSCWSTYMRHYPNGVWPVLGF